MKPSESEVRTTFLDAHGAVECTLVEGPEAPPVQYVIGLTEPERRCYEVLRRIFGPLTLEQTALRERLHAEHCDGHWSSAPMFGPGRAVYEAPSLAPRRGRPRGVSRWRFDSLVDAVRSWRGPGMPTQSWTAEQLLLGGGPEDGARVIRRIVSETGYTWTEFCQRWCRSKSDSSRASGAMRSD